MFINKEYNMTIEELYGKLQARSKARDHFHRGVTEYAKEMLESVIDGDYEINGKCDISELKVSHLLNHIGGDSIAVCDRWSVDDVVKVRYLCSQASFGGNFLIYDADILERLCPISQRRRNMSKAMELQTRALFQAVKIIRVIIQIG
jgi:hypothetical protein